MFDEAREGTGTKEWAEHNVNICRGCANDCLYCYAAANSVRFKQRTRDDWAREEFTKLIAATRYPTRTGVIMFPSSHDITPFNVNEYIRVAKLILQAGNKLLVVTKPRLDCMVELMHELASWREQMLLRFTIGTILSKVSRRWEPNAPYPDERLLALKLAANNGYQTSVSIEPMLGTITGTAATVEAVREYVTDTIWIGKMNDIRRRVPAEHHHLLADIEKWQSDGNIMQLYETYKHDPIIRWKDSIKKVIAKTEGTPA